MGYVRLQGAGLADCATDTTCTMDGLVTETVLYAAWCWCGVHLAGDMARRLMVGRGRTHREAAGSDLGGGSHSATVPRRDRLLDA